MHSLKNQSFLARVKFAAAGIVAALRTEISLRIQVAALALAIGAALLTRPEPLWWALLALASAAVISAELFNTALEHLVDHLHPQVHPNIRIVKDCAAGAVLVASLGALGVATAFVVHLLGR